MLPTVLSSYCPALKIAKPLSIPQLFRFYVFPRFGGLEELPHQFLLELR